MVEVGLCTDQRRDQRGQQDENLGAKRNGGSYEHALIPLVSPHPAPEQTTFALVWTGGALTLIAWTLYDMLESAAPGRTDDPSA